MFAVKSASNLDSTEQTDIHTIRCRRQYFIALLTVKALYTVIYRRYSDWRLTVW